MEMGLVNFSEAGAWPEPVANVGADTGPAISTSGLEFAQPVLQFVAAL